MNARPFSPRLSERFRRWRFETHQHANNSLLNLQFALLVWLILGAAVTVRTLVRPRDHTVFPIFAASAQHWWHDDALYELYPSLDRFRYPPVFALFVTPFSFLGLPLGGILWSWLSIAVFVAGLFCYVRAAIPSAWTRRREALFLMLGALGALRGLWNAQSNALIVGFLLLGVAALARAVERDAVDRRLWWLTAFLLALPLCLKLTPLAPVLLLVVLWPRQLAARLLVVSIGIMALPFLTRPPAIVFEHYREWFEHLHESGCVRWIGFRDGWTIWIVLRHLLGLAPGPVELGEPMDSACYRWVQLATAAAVLLWCVGQRRRCQRLQLGARWSIHLTLSMGLTWLMLFGPAVEHATYVFLAPSLTWALLEREAWPHGRGLIGMAFALIMFLGWGAVTRLLAAEWPIVLAALPAGTALFALWLIGYAATRVKTAREQRPTMPARRLSSTNAASLAESEASSLQFIRDVFH
jgi:hypothetical protein